jgi:hypothetical protein
VGRHPRLLAVSLVAAGWGLWYALYRGYYGLGGTVGMIGTPTSETEWRAADIQDLAFNETWFLAEGILWGVSGTNLGRSPGRRWWTGTALVAIAALTTIGLLSAFGVVGKLIIG